MDRKCLKCQHVKFGATGAELEACPRCGAIYSRVESAQARKVSNKAPPASHSNGWLSLVAIAIATGVGWAYVYGPLAEKRVDESLKHISNKVAADAIDQYHIAKKNGGSAIDVCVQAGMVTAALLQAKNDSAYAQWKQVEKSDCEAAGIQN